MNLIIRLLYKIYRALIGSVNILSIIHKTYIRKSTNLCNNLYNYVDSCIKDTNPEEKKNFFITISTITIFIFTILVILYTIFIDPVMILAIQILTVFSIADEYPYEVLNIKFCRKYMDDICIDITSRVIIRAVAYFTWLITLYAMIWLIFILIYVAAHLLK